MSVQQQATPQVEIQVRVSYIEKESRPEAGYHFFAYHIRIVNRGPVAAKLVSRHWVITDSLGQVEEVRGAGVVGVQPRIGIDQTFEYESACPLPTPFGSMRGSYQMVTDSGETFDVTIPEFYLISPTALH